MFTYPAAVTSMLNERAGLAVKHLIWFEFKTSAGVADPLGLWDGDDTQLFNVLGGTKTFLGAGSVISLGNITNDLNLNVRYQEIALSGVRPEIVNALRGLNVKLMRTYIFRLFLNPASGVVIADPVRIFKGWVDEIQLPREAANSPVDFTIKLASNSRILTRTIPAMRSHESYQERAGDTAFQYAAVSGEIKVNWGPT